MSKPQKSLIELCEEIWKEVDAQARDLLDNLPPADAQEYAYECSIDASTSDEWRAVWKAVSKRINQLSPPTNE